MQWTNIRARYKIQIWVFKTTGPEGSTCAFGSYGIVALPYSCSLNSPSSLENLTKKRAFQDTNMGANMSSRWQPKHCSANAFCACYDKDFLPALVVTHDSYSITVQLIMKQVTWVLHMPCSATLLATSSRNELKPVEPGKREPSKAWSSTRYVSNSVVSLRPPWMNMSLGVIFLSCFNLSIVDLSRPANIRLFHC